MIIMKQTKTELHFVYFSELHNIQFYEVPWNQESINLWNILLENTSTHVHSVKKRLWTHSALL